MRSSLSMLVVLLWISFCSATTIDCITGSTSILDVVTCYEAHYIPSGGMPTLVFPSATVNSALKTLVDAMLSNDGNCSTITVPSAISGAIMVRSFTDNTPFYGPVTYCIAIDYLASTTTPTRYANGWMLFIVPNAKHDIHRHVHFVAVHTGYDLKTAYQNVNAFQQIGGHSVLVTGINRNANTANSACQDGNTATDSAHDNRTALHQAWQQVYATSVTKAWPNVFHVELHGMAEDTCKSGAFITHGTSTKSYYTPTTVIATQLKNLANGAVLTDGSTVVVATPFTDKGCSLVATTNIQGRIVNQVHVGSECGTAATDAQITQHFLHIEQKIAPRGETETFWWDPFRTVFPNDCAGAGRTYNPTTKMCN